MQHQEANKISGTALAADIRSEVTEQIKKLGMTPGLAVVLVGNDPASERYVSLKQKAAQKAGIDFHVYRFDENVREEEILATIRWLNADPDVHAILVQLPLPERLDKDRIIAALDPRKDADGFHPENIKSFLADAGTVAPGLVMGIIQLIVATREPLAGKVALIVAKSQEFASALEHSLASFDVRAEPALPSSEDLAEKTASADIVVTAAGKPGWLTRDMVKQGAILIDVGASVVDGRTVGDVDAGSCKTKAAWISPVPGGVGPLTVAMLLKNTVTLADIHRNQTKNS